MIKGLLYFLPYRFCLTEGRCSQDSAPRHYMYSALMRDYSPYMYGAGILWLGYRYMYQYCSHSVLCQHTTAALNNEYTENHRPFLCVYNTIWLNSHFGTFYSIIIWLPVSVSCLQWSLIISYTLRHSII